jgi:CHAT domain-containing protein
MNPNEARQNAYLQLVQALLTCPPHLEQQLLELNSEFVDMGLVMTLLAVAHGMMQQDNPQATSTSEWLVTFAQQLTQKLGMDMGESPAEDDEEYAKFVLDLLQTVNDSDGDEATVYAFLEEHLTYLNEHLLAIFPQQIDRLLALKTEPEWKLFIASDIHNLAVDLGEFTSGDRSINLELAIICYDRALSVYTQSDFPEEWAMTQNNLANTYRDRIEGDRTANLELAIGCYQAALEVRTPRKYPIGQSPRFANESGRIQANLEATIDLRDTLSQRDRHHPEIYALEVKTSESARFFGELLQSVFDSDGDGRIVHQFLDEHLRYLNKNLLAISAQQAERLLAAKDDPDWKYSIASILNSLAIDLCEFPRGNRAINLELAIACYESALIIRTQADFPIDWAATQNNLANAYVERIEGDRGLNLELAIACYESALIIRTQADFPIDWAATQNNLANAYVERIEGDRGLNLEAAIAGYESALIIRTQADFPIDWATTQNNLANAYLHRVKGDRGLNLEAAIAGYERALLVCNQMDFPLDWATIQMNRATAYAERVKGDRGLNLEAAIAGYECALLVCNQMDFPLDWATIQMNRASAYADLIKGDSPEEKLRQRRENLEAAIQGYDLALLEHTREKFPREWATIQMNRAVVYADRIEGDRGLNLEEAIQSYDLVLVEYTREKLPLQWATTQNNRANAYVERIEGDPSLNLEEAIKGYRAALTVHTPATLPIDALRTSGNLGDVYFRQEKWQPAIHAYETAMKAVETSRIWVLNDESRQELLKDALSIYENAIQCAINLQNYPQAIQFTERIRSRSLVELMESKGLHADAQLPPEIDTYLAEYQDINHQIQSQRQQLQSQHQPSNALGDNTTHPASRDANDLAKLTAAITTLEHQKAKIYHKLRQLDPVLAEQMQVQTIPFASIQQLINTTPHTAILTCYTTDDNTHIFIIKHQGAPTIHTCKNQGWKQLQQWLQTEWINLYHTDLLNWHQNLPHRLHDISQRLELNTLIATHLTDINELIIVPHLNLHQIPFAALPIKGTEELLGDRFIIRSIPSCQILQYCNNRPPITTTIVVGTVEDADDTLLGARYEGAQIAALYNIPLTNRLIGSTQATAANYRALLTRVNRLHSSHHATSRPDNPLESALILAQNERITLRDLLVNTRYPNLDEVFLSACETHVGTTTITDDVATLTTGFLCIGARSVQSTLWSVDDLATVIFNLFYHQQRKIGVTPAIAIQTAQRQLRDLTGKQFKSDYYPTIVKYINDEIDDLKLTIQQSTLDLNTQTEKWEELTNQIDNLTDKIKSIENIRWQSKRYCKVDRPFKDPFYWAGFITQGMG